MKWLKWFKQQKKDTYLTEDLWISDLKRQGRSGFSLIRDNKYEVRQQRNSINMTLKEHVFAWSEIPDKYYNDCVISCRIKLDSNYNAGGILFRQVNEDNFYYFLVSSKGYFRFDALFNGGPITILPWMLGDFNPEDPISLKIIIHGNNFIFLINGDWVGEATGEYFSSGQLGFCGQNFSTESVECCLQSFRVDSLPVNVEKEYTRWNEVASIPAENRLRLAKAFHTIDNLSSAIYQFRQAMKTEALDVADLKIFLQLLITRQFYKEAIPVAKRLIELDKGLDTYLDMASIYYLDNDFANLLSVLAGREDEYDQNDRYWSLIGHAYHMLGYQDKSAEAYLKAFSINNQVPLYALNAAKSYEILEEWDLAEDYYAKAGKEFFLQEAWNDLEWVLLRLEAVAADNPKTEYIRSIIDYHEGRLEEAEESFDAQLASDDYDSQIPYLKALLLQQQGKEEEALTFFEKAVALEDDVFEYWYKLAETQYSVGIDGNDSLAKALELKGDNPWALNLAGKITGDTSYFEKAYMEAKHESVLAVNWASELIKMNKHKEAYDILKAFPENPEALNQVGNILVNEESYEEAIKFYNKAISLAPDEPYYRDNIISAALYLDQFSLAEEHLRFLLDLRPDYTTMFWAGRISSRIGDYPRALVALRESLKLNPSFKEARMSLVQLYMSRLKYEEARNELKELLMQLPDDESVKKLQEKLRVVSEDRYECDCCHREWWVPKNLPEEKPLRLRGELPDHVPAGECPECKAIYCIGCIKDHLVEGRPYCLKCNVPLKLGRSALRYLIRTGIENEP
ncbi:tetratricopeptide repeat protein [Spirochaeta cellobiosiphila]|uniref:tetratricopeptide repeat protein n=1 Tax=Spirochaeta cellobiosiphila TaxID=504483 RepID=UPI00040BC574|nr:tetratricopeptide repeat protein [Spirochaeta cellobiosiphila]